MKILIQIVLLLLFTSKCIYAAGDPKLLIKSVEPKEFFSIYKDTKIKIIVDKNKLNDDLEKLSDTDKKKLISKSIYMIEYGLNDDALKKITVFNVKQITDENSINTEDEITFVMNDLNEIKDLADDKNLSLKISIYEMSSKPINYRLNAKNENLQEFDAFKQNIKSDEDFKKNINDYLENGKVNRIKIATIRINKNPQEIINYKYIESLKDNFPDASVFFKIKKVSFSMVDGVINNIRVTAERVKDKQLFYFKNNEAPISNLTNFDKRSKIYLTDVSTYSYLIKLEDFITLEPEKDIDFAPENSDFTLINNETDYQKDLYANDNLNLLINARVYTNLISFFSNEQNTLLATEISAKILANNNNIKKSFSYYFKYIKLFGTYLKNNNSDNKIDLTNTQTRNKFGRIFTVANSVYTYGLELNLFEFKRRQNLNFDVNLSFTGGKTIVTKIDGANEDVEHTSWNLNPVLEFKALRNAGLELSLGVHFLKFSQNSFIELHNDHFNIFSFNLPTPVYSWSGTLFYFTSNNSLNSIYFRVKSTFDKYEKNIVQFQTGFNVNIGQVKF